MQNIKQIIDAVHDQAKLKIENGRVEDQNGNLIRLDTIKEQDIVRDTLVRQLARDCAVVADEIHSLKAKLDERIASHIEQLASLYGVKIGGKKGNVVLTSFDKRLKITRSKQDRQTTNEHILVAVELINECVKSWSKGANRNLQAFVAKYLRTDGKGNYNVTDLQRLAKVELATPDEKWDSAMAALTAAIEHDYTATYYRAFYRTPSGHYVQIPLDIAKI